MSQRMTDALSTDRLRVIAANASIIDAELESRNRLAQVLDAAVPSDWPPEHHELETLRFWRHKLSERGAGPWWLHYVLLVDGLRTALVGTVAYKGPPVDGMVEVGYSIVPSWQRHGLATEATRALIEYAWERGVEVVGAQTLPHLEPSLGVLHKLGFVQTESNDPNALAFALRRDPDAEVSPRGRP
jgi:RimJ/RimL family protein N-acetyltransferase